MSPRIYELPAGVNQQLDVTPRRSVQRPRPQQRRRQQGSANPRQMLASQMDMELNNITRWFDSQVGVLDQQQLEPDKYKAAYARLQQQGMNQRVAAQAKYEGMAQQIKNMQALVKNGMLTPDEMESGMLGMAGISIRDIKAGLAQKERQKPMARLRDFKYVSDRMETFRANFKEKRGKLYLFNPKTKKILRSASEAETKEYDTSEFRLNEVDKEMWQLYSEVSPLERTALAGMMAARQRARAQEPSTLSKMFGYTGLGLMIPRFREAAQLIESTFKEKQPTAVELRKQKTKEAYQQGIKLGYWE